MPEYRRNLLAGGCFFFTVNLLDRRSDLLVAHVDVLREAVRQVQGRTPFTIDAWVVLPDHMHCLWTLPEGDADFPGRWRAIKTAFSTALPGVGGSSDVMTARGERGIWQRRYWNTRYATSAIMRLTWTTRTSTRSSTGMCRIRRIGRILRFVDVWRQDDIRRGGRVARMSRRRRASVVERSWRNALRFSALRLLHGGRKRRVVRFRAIARD